MGHEIRYSKDTFQTRLKWQNLDPDYLRQLVGLAKIEDLAGPDSQIAPCALVM